MSPRVRLRDRLNVVLQMVTALITAILLGQLWLFTITLDAMENGAVPTGVAAAAVVCSVLACAAIWMLIRFFLRTELAETGER
jgi:phosphate/sulfate permease